MKIIKQHPFVFMVVLCVMGILCLNAYAALTNTYDTSTPAGSDDPREADDRMREIKAAVQERMNDHNGQTDEGDHYWPKTGTEVSDDDTGQHRMVTLRQLADNPSTLTSYAVTTDLGFLYQKDVDGNGELFYQDEADNVIQLTVGGLLSDITPPGTVQMYAGASAPAGWVLCDGTAYSRTVTYDGLFAVTGTTYGVGDGSTTFNVPDMRGRVPLGVGTGDASDATAHALADKEGTETHALAFAESPGHNHQWYDDGTGTNAIDCAQTQDGQSYSVAGANTNFSDPIQQDLYTNTQQDLSVDGSAHNNLQPSLTLNFIIKI